MVLGSRRACQGVTANQFRQRQATCAERASPQETTAANPHVAVEFSTSLEGFFHGTQAGLEKQETLFFYRTATGTGTIAESGILCGECQGTLDCQHDNA